MPVNAGDDAIDASEMPAPKKATIAAVKAGKGATGKKRTAPKKAVKKAKTAKSVPTPSTSDGDEDIDIGEEEGEDIPDLSDGTEIAVPIVKKRLFTGVGRQTGRGAKKAVWYADGIEEDDD